MKLLIAGLLCLGSVFAAPTVAPALANNWCGTLHISVGGQDPDCGEWDQECVDDLKTAANAALWDVVNQACWVQTNTTDTYVDDMRDLNEAKAECLTEESQEFCDTLWDPVLADRQAEYWDDRATLDTAAFAAIDVISDQYLEDIDDCCI